MSKRTQLILLSALLCSILVCVLFSLSNSGLIKTDTSCPDSLPLEIPYQTTEDAQQSTEQDIEVLLEEHNRLAISHNEAVISYNESIDSINAANASLSLEIEKARTALAAGDIPYDSQTQALLEQSIQSATDAMVLVPEALHVEDILEIPANATSDDIAGLRVRATAGIDVFRNTSVPVPLGAPDYTAIIEKLLDAINAFELSVMVQKQITTPTDEFVLERLKRIDTIVSIGAVTSDNDPNGLLGTEGGYIGCIYFSDVRVDKSLLNLKPGQYDVISMGTVGGGAIEIYATVEDAASRNAYLSSYDNTTLHPGSHLVLGTMVVRTSSKLSHEQQNELVNQIISVLTELDT